MAGACLLSTEQMRSPVSTKYFRGRGDQNINGISLQIQLKKNGNTMDSHGRGQGFFTSKPKREDQGPLPPKNMLQNP
jgi:hypothetical protein